MNTATVIGRAGQDAEIRYFESGKVKTTFSLAVNRWDSKSKENVTDWFNIEVWDKQAEFAGEYVKKGREVAVDGRISISKWTDQTGEEKERFLIVANDIRLLGSRRDVEG
ncbi:single-stranded DNA-binding protein [bacterium]|nr:single-stranded DNA-binding protein [bacterium]